MPTKPKTLAIVPKQVLRLACISVVPVLVACGDDDADHPQVIALAVAGYGGSWVPIALAVGGFGGPGGGGNIALGVGGFGGGGMGGAIALAVGGFGGGDEDAGTEDAGES
jgi:hypothetical protein